MHDSPTVQVLQVPKCTSTTGIVSQMLPNRLRQRRAPSSSPLLPLHYDADVNGITIRSHNAHKRRGRAKGMAILKRALLCLSLSSLFVFGLLRLFPLGITTTNPSAIDTNNDKSSPESLIEFLRRSRGSFALWSRRKNGNNKDNRKTFSYSTIRCPDGSTGYLNDDYCDCHDGSDEPETSACSNVLVTRKTFRCRDGSSLLLTSRVRDGIVDCRDGSDEIPT